ncbi:non-ribosomal peptide synthetase [Catenovulum sp. 2E275]|uniref:non-ribosomal peptide synthetase n=1 Tax=Catenovulum sp. 2E275 TaxID=2980497 RepID=UPI0021CE4A63|nr:non-ribosomal peptide synthetase [Catenovulum sp. 2E275]MCU4674821.1 non-ribosomal peptide synthetase [Catenovulum sp. 2E275]
MFFNYNPEYADNIAVHDVAVNQSVTYAQLNELVNARMRDLGEQRKLIFVEANNNIQSIVDYLACLRGLHVVYLLEKMDDVKTKQLIDLYRPNLLLKADGDIIEFNREAFELHSDLALLLSTSGSTGTPKFVKLSQQNIQANAASIAEYLKLTAADKALSHLKLHYSYGLSVLNSHLAVGASVILTQHNVISAEFWDDVNSYHATSFAGVPYTFESLLQKNFEITKYPSLRYITQAGGKLEAKLVTEFSNLCKAAEVEFFVMYGQTEAAPRISYLPPELIETHPGCIGRAIPGGTLSLLDENGQTITEKDKPGELVYQGPNVMMGYAEKPADLALDETPDRLLTGDIACFTDHDLFYIVGRTKRFVKLYGLRINLDEIQSYIKLTYSQSAVTGTDQKVIIALEMANNEQISAQLISDVASRYGLPESVFTVRFYSELPLMASGKYDFKQILADDEIKEKPPVWQSLIGKITDILELNQSDWESILQLYRDILNKKDIQPADSFNSLHADSLSFVSLTIELENCLGEEMPKDWQDKTIAELDKLYEQVRLTA